MQSPNQFLMHYVNISLISFNQPQCRKEVHMYLQFAIDDIMPCNKRMQGSTINKLLQELLLRKQLFISIIAMLFYLKL